MLLFSWSKPTFLANFFIFQLKESNLIARIAVFYLPARKVVENYIHFPFHRIWYNDSGNQIFFLTLNQEILATTNKVHIDKKRVT
jgi:hypothetical protein